MQFADFKNPQKGNRPLEGLIPLMKLKTHLRLPLRQCPMALLTKITGEIARCRNQTMTSTGLSLRRRRHLRAHFLQLIVAKKIFDQIMPALSNRLTVPYNLLETFHPSRLILEQTVNDLLLHAAIAHILCISTETVINSVSFFVVVVDKRGSCAAITACAT